MSLNTNEKFKNGTIDNKVLLFTPTINAIIPGNNAINVRGVNALWASLKLLHILAIAIHKPLINNENTIITKILIIILGALNVILALSYIVKVSFAILKAIKASIKLRTPVIIDDNVTDKSLPTIISLLLIGKVSKVSKVPLSYSPAVVSVAG